MNMIDQTAWFQALACHSQVYGPRHY